MKNKTAYLVCLLRWRLFELCGDLDPILWNPWDKLGLANLVIVIVLYTYGGKEAFLLSVTRISAVRIFVWESEYDSLQYGRGRFQSRHHGVAS